MQGIGYALSEEIVIEEGNNRSSLFADYLIQLPFTPRRVLEALRSAGERVG